MINRYHVNDHSVLFFNSEHLLWENDGDDITLHFHESFSGSFRIGCVWLSLKLPAATPKTQRLKFINYIENTDK